MKYFCYFDFIDLSRVSCLSKNYVIMCMYLLMKLKVIMFNCFFWMMGVCWMEFDECLWMVNDYWMKNVKRVYSGWECIVNDMLMFCECKINDLCEVLWELFLYCIFLVIRKNSKLIICNVVLFWKLI